MSTAKYSILKDHFDKLILNGYPANTGLEPIRSSYEQMFGKPINRQDVYTTKFKISTNPISGIITLLGDDDDIQTGLMSIDDFGSNGVYYITHFTNDILKDTINIRDYILTVFDIIYNIIEYDNFSVNLNKNVRRSPYVATLYSYPFYFTFHHIKKCFPEHINNPVFNDIFEKYYNGEFTNEVLESLNKSQYTTDPELIYAIMTCENLISLL